MKRQTLLDQRNPKLAQSQIFDPKVSSQAKIHRANLICRILHAYTLTRLEHSFVKIAVTAKNNARAHKKMGLAINSIFRKFAFEEKFNAFYKLRRIMINAGDQQIKENQKILRNMQKSAGNIIYIMLKGKRKTTINSAFLKIKEYALESHQQKRAAQRKAIRRIQQILLREKKQAYNKLKTTQVISDRKRKLKIISNMLRNKHRERLHWVLWKLSCNNIYEKRQQILMDVKNYEQKIANHKDPEIEALREKREKLQEHLERVRKEKQQMEQQYQNQFNEIENQKAELTQKKATLQKSNQELEEKIKKTQQQINAPYSLDQIYQTLYNNFLLFLHENKEQMYNKEKVLQSLTIPLIPVDVPIQSIKEQNKVMEELLNEYIVLFGPKKLQEPIEMPYQYLVKENHAMYKMLVTLLPELDRDREDLKALRDSVYKLNAKVTELWGE